MDVSAARAFALSLLLFGATAFSTFALADTASSSVGPTVGPVIEKGKKVDIEYTLTLDDGSTVQSNVGGPPLVFVVGEGQVIPGLEAALQGKAARERVKVKIAPDQAYGPLDPKKVQEVALDKIPEDARKVGTLLSAQGFDGPIRVAEVRPDVVVLDFNHPLAGKALTFDVLVLSIN
jgi:FKBP-type peptidyl-prolyl cis-trans isomerase 2